MISPRHEALMNFTGFRCSWVTLLWQQRWTEGCQVSPLLSHLWWHSSVTGAEPPPPPPTGGLGWERRRKKGRKRLAGPRGPNAALMTDASVALRWNWSGCSMMARKRPRGREEYTMQDRDPQVWQLLLAALAGCVAVVQLKNKCLKSCYIGTH